MRRLALSVDEVRVTGAASGGESVGPTLVLTHSESGSRPYIDAQLEINPLYQTCSVRVIVLVQAMGIVFDAVSARSSL